MRTTLLLASSLAVAGCHSPKTSAMSPDPPPEASSTTTGAALVDASAVSAVTPDAGYGDALNQLAASNNALGLDVYGASRRGHPNLTLSPLSISMALTMAWAGARGETAAQMKSVLHVDGSVERTLGAESALLAWVRDPTQTVTLRVANRLFGEKSSAFEPSYVDQTRAAFGAALEPLDFLGAPDASRRSINDWVAEQTDGHIQDLIPSGGVSSKTRLVLANAVYFLGLWERPFRTEETKPAAFHTSITSAHDVPTMHEMEHLLFAQVDGVKVLQIPYKGDRSRWRSCCPTPSTGSPPSSRGCPPRP